MFTPILGRVSTYLVALLCWTEPYESSQHGRTGERERQRGEREREREREFTFMHMTILHDFVYVICTCTRHIVLYLAGIPPE